MPLIKKLNKPYFVSKLQDIDITSVVLNEGEAVVTDVGLIEKTLTDKGFTIIYPVPEGVTKVTSAELKSGSDTISKSFMNIDVHDTFVLKHQIELEGDLNG